MGKGSDRVKRELESSLPVRESKRGEKHSRAGGGGVQFKFAVLELGTQVFVKEVRLYAIGFY